MNWWYHHWWTRKLARYMNIGGAVGDGHDTYVCGPCMHVWVCLLTITSRSSLERRQSHNHLVWSDMMMGLCWIITVKNITSAAFCPSLQATSVLSTTHHQSPVVSSMWKWWCGQLFGTPPIMDDDDPCMHVYMHALKWTSL